MFSIAISLLTFQRLVFLYFKQTNVAEWGWAGGGGLAMKQGAAATGTCKQVGAVVGDQDWRQEIWVLSLLCNRPTGPLAIADICTCWPTKKDL